MIKLDALTKIATENKIAYMMNVAKVKKIKESIKDETRMIELCFKECDNMLAAKITIQNVGIPFSDEFGVNEKFLTSNAGSYDWKSGRT